MNKNIFKIRPKISALGVLIFSLIALIVFSLTVFIGNQVFAHGGDADFQAEEMTKEEFMNIAEARYEFMEKIDRLPEDISKEEYMEMQENMYEMYDKYGDMMGPGMMMGGFGGGCPMHSETDERMMFGNNSSSRGFMGSGMMF